jgi:hypothetical protein
MCPLECNKWCIGCSCLGFWLQRQRALSPQDANRNLRPCAKAWLSKLAAMLPEDQSNAIVDALVNAGYTSAYLIKEEDTNTILSLSLISGLKAGAKLAFKKQLEELKVRSLNQIRCMKNRARIDSFLWLAQNGNFMNDSQLTDALRTEQVRLQPDILVTWHVTQVSYCCMQYYA